MRQPRRSDRECKTKGRIFDIFGKMKTVSQMIWVATTIVQMYLEEELLIGIPLLAEMNIVLMWVTLGLTVVSGINYLWKNRAVLSDMK